MGDECSPGALEVHMGDEGSSDALEAQHSGKRGSKRGRQQTPLVGGLWVACAVC
jgi:hypothetical protein